MNKVTVTSNNEIVAGSDEAEINRLMEEVVGPKVYDAIQPLIAEACASDAHAASLMVNAVCNVLMIEAATVMATAIVAAQESGEFVADAKAGLIESFGTNFDTKIAERRRSFRELIAQREGGGTA